MTNVNRGVSITLAAVLAVVLVMFSKVSAQPANAPPGTICVTPTFWCPAARPGPPGSPCSCQTASGWVAGVLR